MPCRHVLSIPAACLAACLATAGPAMAQDGGAPDARGTFVDAQGQEIGTAELSETPNGILIRIDAEGLPPGPHGYHIHQTGTCEPPEFTSAGGHFNPQGESHGVHTPGLHAGDLPNVTVPDDGRLVHDAFVRDLALTGDGALLDDDGAALMIHADADDYATDPSGNSGARIACAVIEGEG